MQIFVGGLKSSFIPQPTLRPKWPRLLTSKPWEKNNLQKTNGAVGQLIWPMESGVPWWAKWVKIAPKTGAKDSRFPSIQYAKEHVLKGISHVSERRIDWRTTKKNFPRWAKELPPFRMDSKEGMAFEAFTGCTSNQKCRSVIYKENPRAPPQCQPPQEIRPYSGVTH